MDWKEKLDQGLRKLDHYLDHAAEILEKAGIVIAVTPLAKYAGVLAVVLRIVQFVEDLTPEIDQPEAEFAGTAKLDMAVDLAQPILEAKLGYPVPDEDAEALIQYVHAAATA